MRNIIDITDLVRYAPVGDEIDNVVLLNELTFAESISLPGIFRNRDIVTNMLAMDPDEATNDNAELWNFWNFYVKPVAALEVFVRLIQTHGMAINGSGIMIASPGNNTAQQVTEEQRAIIVRKYRSTLKSYTNGLRYEFEEVKRTFDGIEYEVQERYGNERRTGDMSALSNVNDNLQKPTFRL